MIIKCIEGPCKECAERHMGCHSECERYLKYKQQIKEIHEKVNFRKLMERRR